MSSDHLIPANQRLRFGSFEADLASGQLRKKGVKIQLREQSFEVLATLLTHPGQVVTRDDLCRQLWHGDVHVDFDKSLNTIVGRLRAVLGDSAEYPRYIETLPRRGYRFIADVGKSPAISERLGSTRVRLAVLPFANLSKDSGEAYLADAVTEELITALASLAQNRLAVIARTTAMHYRGSHKDVARIGRELSADYIVEGAVRRNCDSVVINVQLIQTSDEVHLFAERYDCQSARISKIQTSIARKIAAHIPGLDNQVRGDSIRPTHPSSKPTDDLVALNEYIHGRAFIDKGNATAMAAARHHLERAVTLDPEFAQAYDALAEVYWYLGYMGMMRPREAFAAGIVHAVRAIEIDGTRAETHALLGQFHKISEYNWTEVRREMNWALKLDPNSPQVRMRYALSDLMPHGRIDEAIAELDYALGIDPFSVWARTWLGIMLVLGGRYDRAIDESHKLLDLDPACPQAFFVLSLSYRYQSKSDEAVGAIRDAVELSGGTAMMMGWLGLTLASCGKDKEARGVLQQLTEMAAEKYVPPCSFAWIHLGLGEIDAAFEWLARAVDECDQLLMPIKTYAFLNPIRNDRRFAELLQRMNLQ